MAGPRSRSRPALLDRAAEAYKAASEAYRGATDQVIAKVGRFPGVGRTLLRIRDEALRLTDKMEGAMLERGERLWRATDRGEFLDAVAKSLARHAVETGDLPKDLQIAPGPSSITSRQFPSKKLIDFLAPNGKGYDLMTATRGQLADHEKKYLGRTQDGVEIKEVLPLLHPKRGRPWLDMSTIAQGFGVVAKGIGIVGGTALGVGVLAGTATAAARERARSAEQARCRTAQQAEDQRRRTEAQQREARQRFAEEAGRRQARDQQLAQERARQQEQARRDAAERVRQDAQRTAERQRQEQMRKMMNGRPKWAAPPQRPPPAYKPPPTIRRPIGSVFEGAGFSVRGTFGTPAYQRSIIRGMR